MPRLLPHLSTLLLVLCLAACATVPSQNGALPAASGSVVAAETAEANGDWQQAASEWLAIAAKADDLALHNYNYRAVEALLKAEDALRARVVFDSIETQFLAPQLQASLPLTQAALLLAEGRPGEALVVLPLSAGELASADLAPRFLWLRATAFAEQGALVPAIEDFSARDRLLIGGGAEQRDWQLKLWPLLVTTESRLLKEGVRRNATTEVAGWLRLGLIGKDEWLDVAGFERKLDEWEAKHPLHAAKLVLVPALRAAHARRQKAPDNIAVMLPLTGRYAAVGSAVRDGLLAAWYEQGAGAALSKLNFVDTEAVSANDWLEQQGEAESLALIGPLRKEKVDALAALVLPETLLWLPLNQASVKQAAINKDIGLTPEMTGVVALALSPEQEAQAVAERMGREGHRRALVIAAEGDWGQRVSDAFTERFIKTGGKVVGVERYDSAKSDHGDTIQRALLLNQSERRHARVTRALGRNVMFEARRRVDVDAVFAPGMPRALRALRPQLKFYHAGALPVYATSHVWQGKINPAADLDLNGVRFADMPWNLQPTARDKRLKQKIEEAGGNAKRGSFFALGADALRVLPILSDRDATFPWVFPGATGQLEPGTEGMLKRKLVWAEFKKGKPRLLSAANLSASR